MRYWQDACRQGADGVGVWSPLALFLFWPPWLTQRLHLKGGLIFGNASGCGYGEEGQKEARGVSGPVGQAVALKSAGVNLQGLPPSFEAGR